MLIFLFGDSHGGYNFVGMDLPYVNMSHSSITMHRIGRDNKIVNFEQRMNSNEHIFVLCYGEVDCRCHIIKQIELGREEDEIISELVEKYMQTIRNNMTHYKSLVIVSVTPPIIKEEYIKRHGPVTHEFPFLGTDLERVRFTQKMNVLLKQKAKENGYLFLDIYDHYSTKDGLLKTEMSDGICHIQDNKYAIESLKNVLKEQTLN